MKLKLNEPFGVKVQTIEYSETSTISGQDYDIGELLERWSQGQRLNVHMRPIEYETDENREEAFQGDMLPNFEDITELVEYQQQHEQRKSEFKERLAKRKSEKVVKPSDVAPDASPEGDA